MPDRPDPLTDPVARALARFTPAAGLERDEMLFRAGRASARTGWLLRSVAALLLATNAVTLALWLSASPRQVVVIESPPTPGPGLPTEPPQTEIEPSAPSWIASTRRTGELPPRPAGTDAHLIGSKPLTIRSGLTSPSDL